VCVVQRRRHMACSGSRMGRTGSHVRREGGVHVFVFVFVFCVFVARGHPGCWVGCGTTPFFSVRLTVLCCAYVFLCGGIGGVGMGREEGRWEERRGGLAHVIEGCCCGCGLVGDGYEAWDGEWRGRGLKGGRVRSSQQRM
jgi:hypothetical protein